VTGSEERSERFLARWSRLKRRERDPVQRQADPEGARPAAQRGQAADGPPAPEPRREAPAADIDLASLPPLESITAASDIRAFLQSGVPAELTKAALRRAWTSDPAIRDFIGIAENQWDFTDPGAIAGFGPLEAGEDIKALVRQALGEIAPEPRDGEGSSSRGTAPPAEASTQAYGIPARKAATAGGEEPVEGQQNVPSAAAQHAEPSAVASAAPSRRSHGGALPK
jgi:hypothetical protein